MRYLVFFTLLIFSTISLASELTIKAANTVLETFTKESLLARPDVETIVINNNPAYKNITLTYTGIKLCNLLSKQTIATDSKITFIAADGFASAIPAQLLLTCDANHPTAYLAVEGDKKWPALPHGTGSAGPYTVIWQTHGTALSAEYWPWQVISIDLTANTQANASLPKPKTNDLSVIKGYELFQANCAACHRMNGIGMSHLGPDLNQPLNPVEYFKNTTLLKQFIRNPQSIRYFKEDRMPGVKEALSESELNALIRFLSYMSKQR